MRPANPRLPWALTALALALVSPLLAADEPAKAKDQPRPRAPAGFVIVESNNRGAYFVARPLKERYDALLKRVATLQAEIADARIDAPEARRQLDALGVDLASLRREIDAARLYVPGAPSFTATATATIPLAADALLLVDASDIDLRGSDGPGLKCVIEKTVFGETEARAAADFAAIALSHRIAPAREFFGYYEGADKRPGGQAEWEHFPFKEYLGHDLTYVTLKGLALDEGNTYIDFKTLNEGGEGSHSSRPRRNARLTLYVPKCRRVAVRGALGGFKVRSLASPLSVLGDGNRDYGASFEVSDLDGPLVAENIPLHRLERIHGDVSVSATAYAENIGTGHGPEGVTMRSYTPATSIYKDIQGALRVRFCRADLAVENVSGRVDVENDFGRTSWLADLAVAKVDHRLVTQSGTIALRLGKPALAGLPLAMFSECGAVHLAPGLDNGFESKMFSSMSNDTARRSWHGFLTRPQPDARTDPFALFNRVADALHARPRTPGIDVISRAGTITVDSPEGGAPR